jgi:hypothetical protein
MGIGQTLKWVLLSYTQYLMYFGLSNKTAMKIDLVCSTHMLGVDWIKCQLPQLYSQENPWELVLAKLHQHFCFPNNQNEKTPVICLNFYLFLNFLRDVLVEVCSLSFFHEDFVITYLHSCRPTMITTWNMAL